MDAPETFTMRLKKDDNEVIERLRHEIKQLAETTDEGIMSAVKLLGVTRADAVRYALNFTLARLVARRKYPPQ